MSRTRPGSFRRAIIVVAAVALAGCEDAEAPAPLPPPPAVVAPAGSYAVGTSRFELGDETRPEPHTEATGDHRRMMVRAWYPAAAAAAPAPYFLDRIEASANAVGLGLPTDAFAQVPTHAALDVPAAAGRFPVLVFSPGRNIPPAFYSYELEDLASRGYAVFALAHPYGAYGTGVVVFGDGTIALPFGPVHPAETRDEAVGTWSADQRFALGAIAALAQPGSGHPLAGGLDLDRVAVFGHSLGGAAASQSCVEDARLSACANLDGSVGTVVQGGAPIARPFLLLRAESTVESTLDDFFASLAGPSYQLRVRGAGRHAPRGTAIAAARGQSGVSRDQHCPPSIN